MVKEKVQPIDIDLIEINTIELIKLGEERKVKMNFRKMEKMFRTGTEETRDLIANQFIHPLTTWLELNYSYGKKYLLLLPVNMNKEHNRQIYSSGI